TRRCCSGRAFRRSGCAGGHLSSAAELPPPPADQAKLAQAAPQPNKCVCSRGDENPEDDFVSPTGCLLADDDDFSTGGSEPLSKQLGTGQRLASQNAKFASQTDCLDRCRRFNSGSEATQCLRRAIDLLGRA